jgi:hypothetical protein
VHAIEPQSTGLERQVIHALDPRVAGKRMERATSIDRCSGRVSFPTLLSLTKATMEGDGAGTNLMGPSRAPPRSSVSVEAR